MWCLLPAAGLCVKSEGRRERPVEVDVCLQVCDLVLGRTNGIGTGDESSGRWLLTRDSEEGLRELGRIAGLFAILKLPELELRLTALVVIIDGQLGEVRRLLG